MNFLFDMDTQANLIGFASFLALFLFSIGVSQFFRQKSASRELIAKIRGGGIAMEPSAENEADDLQSKAVHL
jgi:hypothetical protein